MSGPGAGLFRPLVSAARKFIIDLAASVLLFVVVSRISLHMKRSLFRLIRLSRERRRSNTTPGPGSPRPT